MLGRLRALGEDPEVIFTGEGYGPAPLTEAERVVPDQDGVPEAVRLDLPDWLMPALRTSLGDDLPDVARALQTRAALGLRVNLARCDHAQADRVLQEDGIESAPHPLAEAARFVTANGRRLRASRAYCEGLVEVQDPASQAVVEALLPVPAGARILDYCAGGGGKALALAAATGAEVFAHDVNPARMQDIPARAARAGAKIRRVTTKETVALGPWDLILVDAPCSGSGAWRRQPEAKWALDAARLSALQEIQSQVLSEAAAILAPGGRLAYATCSVLKAENEDRIDAFLAQAGAGWVQEVARRLSVLDGGDGFFWSHLKRE